MKYPIIFTSPYLRSTTHTQQVAKDIVEALARLDIEHRELQNTNDFWCRDYMPVLLFGDGCYSQYQYRPDYLWDYKTKRQFITDQIEACKELELFLPTNMGIVFDGGNYVRCGNKVIMTDKIFAENPGWSANDLLHHLHHALCAEIIIIPWDMRDKCGHADGMVAPLDDGRLLLNNYVQYKKDTAFYKRLRKILDAHFDVVDLSYNCKLESDAWCYLNFLNLPNGVLLPMLSKSFDCDNDREAIRVMADLFPGKEIIPIYSKPLIEDGGSLHCVTWEYIPSEYHENWQK